MKARYFCNTLALKRFSKKLGSACGVGGRWSDGLVLEELRARGNLTSGGRLVPLMTDESSEQPTVDVITRVLSDFGG